MSHYILMDTIVVPHWHHEGMGKELCLRMIQDYASGSLKVDKYKVENHREYKINQIKFHALKEYMKDSYMG